MKEETKHMDNRYAISNYPDAAAVTKQLDELIKLPIYTISPEASSAMKRIISTKSARSPKR